MNLFDFKIIEYLNQFSNQSQVFDTLIYLISDNDLLKGSILVILIWWAWFQNGSHSRYNREYILLTLFSSGVALLIGLILANFTPFRFRPIHTAGLEFLVPYGMPPRIMEDASSFPSDHAALFFCISTGLLFVSKKIGMFAILYTTLFIAFPRIYLGLHYPTDIIAGAVIGIVTAFVGNKFFLNSKIIQVIKSWSYSWPSYFYPILFLITYQIASLFSASRMLAAGIIKVISLLFS